MTINLLLSVDFGHTILLGFRDLNGNKTFIIHLSNPIALISIHGFLFKIHVGDNIIRFGKSSNDLRTHAYQDSVMNEKHIVGLHDPVNAQDAATKNLVDPALNSVNPQDFANKNNVDPTLSSVNTNPLKKCYVGYIPN